MRAFHSGSAIVLHSNTRAAATVVHHPIGVIPAGPRSVRDIASEDSLEQLSTAELHDLAVRRARHHLDVRFFWRLMQVLPVAEAGAGELREAEADVATLRAHLDDVTDSGRGEVAELLRPFYLDYLRGHGVTAP